jgi:hypothetical protein
MQVDQSKRPEFIRLDFSTARATARGRLGLVFYGLLSARCCLQLWRLMPARTSRRRP